MICTLNSISQCWYYNKHLANSSFLFFKDSLFNRTIIYLKNIFDFSDQKIEMEFKYFFNIKNYIHLFMQYVHIELLTLTWIEPRINGSRSILEKKFPDFICERVVQIVCRPFISIVKLEQFRM